LPALQSKETNVDNTSHRVRAALSHPYTFLVASVALSALAFLAVLGQPHANLFTIAHPFRPSLLLVAAFALSSLCLRKSRLPGRMMIYYIAFYLALFQFVVLTSYIGISLSLPIVNPVREIELAAIGLCILAIALAIVASWVGHRAFF